MARFTPNRETGQLHDAKRGDDIGGGRALMALLAAINRLAEEVADPGAPWMRRDRLVADVAAQQEVVSRLCRSPDDKEQV